MVIGRFGLGGALLGECLCFCFSFPFHPVSNQSSPFPSKRFSTYAVSDSMIVDLDTTAVAVRNTLIRFVPRYIESIV